jgi:mono/diheme cytochrome c family protein
MSIHGERGAYHAPHDLDRQSAMKRDWVAMKLDLRILVLLSAALISWMTGFPCVMAQSPTAPDNAPLDVEQLFASTCGWCHSDGGRVAGKGPQLMDSARSDDFLRDRIKMGKSGAMPAFGSVYSDAQIDEIIKYIRSLKPQQG